MVDKKHEIPLCALCMVNDRACRMENGIGPVYCPTKNEKKIIEQAIKEYENPAVREFARIASIQEGSCFSNGRPVKSRVQEICEFAKRMSYKKLGVAFCGGLHSEAKILADILKAQGFNVVSVVCKVGCTPKEAIGVKDNEKIRSGKFESMCSPIVQATLLNEEKTDFNILVGLCVGHDSLFLKYSKAFTTVLVAKDRVLAHNPVGALYTANSGYAHLLRSRIEV